METNKEAGMLVIEPVIEAGWDETAYLERDPVLMKRIADDKRVSRGI
jgi:hypothetical protein